MRYVYSNQINTRLTHSLGDILQFVNNSSLQAGLKINSIVTEYMSKDLQNTFHLRYIMTRIDV